MQPRLIGVWKESDFFNKEFRADQPPAYHMIFAPIACAGNFETKVNGESIKIEVIVSINKIQKGRGSLSQIFCLIKC